MHKIVFFILSWLAIFQRLAYAGVKRKRDSSGESPRENSQVYAKTIWIGETPYNFENEEQLNEFNQLKSLLDTEGNDEYQIDSLGPHYHETFTTVFEYTVTKKLPGSLNEIQNWRDLLHIWDCANHNSHEPLLNQASLQLADIFMRELNFNKAISNVELTPVAADTIMRHIIHRALENMGLIKVIEYLRGTNEKLY